MRFTQCTSQAKQLAALTKTIFSNGRPQNSRKGAVGFLVPQCMALKYCIWMVRFQTFGCCCRVKRVWELMNWDADCLSACLWAVLSGVKRVGVLTASEVRFPLQAKSDPNVGHQLNR